jgi:hypothetical protein
MMPAPARPPAMAMPPANAACANPATDGFILLKEKCGAACHNPGNPALYAASLDLFNANAKARLVNAASKVCPGKTLVVDRPDGVTGHLFDKMLTGEKPACGDRMPPVGTGLTAAEIKCIKDWIRPTP